jgi:hypothetical protein
MTVHRAPKLTPWLLSRKIICAAYLPAPFNDAERALFLGLHAMTVVKVIARHLRMGYVLKDVERRGNGYRTDLILVSPSGRRRVSEVKSAKEIKEVHRIQAALYANAEVEEIAVSNRNNDEVLDARFVQDILRRAQLTRQLLTQDPSAAASAYTPHHDICGMCANGACPFLAQPNASALQTETRC